VTSPTLFELFLLEAAVDEIVGRADYFMRNGGPELAQCWDESVFRTVQSLRSMPHRGASCRLFGPKLHDLRRIAIDGFDRHLVLYTVDDTERILTVVAVLHTSQDIAIILGTPRS
jgi:plasmid stabilization system protein ParE